MIAGYFLRGLLIGLVFGVPAGAIGALTIQRTLEKGFFGTDHRRRIIRSGLDLFLRRRVWNYDHI